jgi:hypothetical protein
MEWKNSAFSKVSISFHYRSYHRGLLSIKHDRTNTKFTKTKVQYTFQHSCINEDNIGKDPIILTVKNVLQ